MKERDKKELQAAQANRLKELIKELGITQREFCSQIETTEVFISRLVTAKTTISEGLAYRIGAKYGINPQWLLSGEGQKYNENQTSQLQKANQLKQIASIRATIQQLTQQLDQLEAEVTK